MWTLIMWHNRFCQNENGAVETHIPRHRDSKTKKSRHPDSKTKKPRHRETETTKPRPRDSKAFFQRTKSHDIEIPRPKATTSSFFGILTLMPPDSCAALSCIATPVSYCNLRCVAEILSLKW